VTKGRLFLLSIITCIILALGILAIINRSFSKYPQKSEVEYCLGVYFWNQNLDLRQFSVSQRQADTLPSSSIAKIAYWPYRLFAPKRRHSLMKDRLYIDVWKFIGDGKEVRVECLVCMDKVTDINITKNNETETYDARSFIKKCREMTQEM